jgi:hypothetical protein
MPDSDMMFEVRSHGVHRDVMAMITPRGIDTMGMGRRSAGACKKKENDQAWT